MGLLQPVPIGKADKVTGAVADTVAKLQSGGNLKASTLKLPDVSSTLYGLVMVKSEAVDFKTAQTVDLLEIPSGYAFHVYSVDIVTVSITTPGGEASADFGTSADHDAYFAGLSVPNAAGAIGGIDKSWWDGCIIPSGQTVALTVATPSGAAAHSGYFTVSGFLVEA